jgi:hypothetical protein
MNKFIYQVINIDTWLTRFYGFISYYYLGREFNIQSELVKTIF